MARIGRGILDSFSGTVGTVVGSTWRGIDYMRSKSKKRRRNFNEEQLEQQARFAFASKFIPTMKYLYKVTLKNVPQQMTSLNEALSTDQQIVFCSVRSRLLTEQVNSKILHLYNQYLHFSARFPGVNLVA